MLRTALALAALLLALPLAAQAQTVKAFQFVGNTTELVVGGSGVQAMTRACQAEYPASKMCTSEEYAQTVKMPAPSPDDNGRAWIRPSFVPTGSAGVQDLSGIDGTPINLTCSGWRSSESSNGGLVVTSTGGFRTTDCNQDRYVTCCALIPVPEPPMSMMNGTAAATLATLAFYKALATPLCGS
jgi:hypothetical protein